MSDDSHVYTRDDLRNLQEHAHILRALEAALRRWDEVSVIAFRATSAESMRQDLGALLDLDETQTTAVMDMQVRRVAAEERVKIRQMLVQVESEIALATTMLDE